ncbi:MAG: fused MFS/spermidine synthase, partial [Candidatus Accumulibacter sp.]|nr:fused MFS/spermidine synthase [Accumulibacter sp.]
MKKKKDKIKGQDEEYGVTGARWVLALASFLCGMAVMVLEMAGSRIVAPYMGTSLIVWTALIGVIMASLSAGYWLGGIVADRRPEMKLLAWIVLAAALLTGAAALGANPVLAALSRLPGLYLAPVAGAVALFAAPGVLLGMVSPFIVRLAMRGVDSSGATVGRFSALSATGSILGTFLGGFVLIAHFSSGTVLLLVATVLAFVTALLQWDAGRGNGKKAAPAALLCAVFFGVSWAAEVLGLPLASVGAHVDTLYNHILVADREYAGRRTRYLTTGALNEGAQSVIYPDRPDDLASDYTRFYDLAFHYRPEAKKILMLGGGGYCVPRHLLATRRDVSVDVVELDPGITAVAREFFFLRDEGNPNISIQHEDARIFLNREAGRRPGAYDAIFADVFGSWYSIPFHLTTVEAARAMSALLSEDGVLVSNVISSLRGPGSGVLGGIYAALSEVFPRVLVFPASRPEAAYAEHRQNVMLVAFKSEKTFAAA